MKEVIKGKVTELFNEQVRFLDKPMSEGIEVAGKELYSLFEKFVGKYVKIVIEEISE